MRENGGQYTHAAVWAAMAFAALGDRERAWALYSMLNPLSHAGDAAAVAIYQVEPYVIAGDIYANASHVGRGGWTWYTGSAGWMLRLTTESLLGVQRCGNRLRLCPLLPSHWKGFDMQYRFGTSRYDIRCHRATGQAATSVVQDGVETEGDAITLVDDGQVHAIIVCLGHALA